MESPPSGAPTRVFLRACAINNREWARARNPAWVRPCECKQIAEIQRFSTFTLCKSETHRAHVSMRIRGHTGTSVGSPAHPKITPIFGENCPYTHTPIHAHLLLPCAHNACVVVPECQRVALCALTRVHALVVCAHDCVPECPLTHVPAHNAPRYTHAHPHTHECAPMYAPKCGIAYCVRVRPWHAHHALVWVHNTARTHRKLTRPFSCA